MRFEMTKEEARFLDAHLVRHIKSVEDELVHTDRHEMQHELAREVSALRALHERLENELTRGMP
jgi:polyhydroxyalkanoate synthesis regulator phasin